MWWACLPRDDEFNRVPTALAVLHQDRHWIFTTRERAEQWLAGSLGHRHPFHTADPTIVLHGSSLTLEDSKREKIQLHEC